jgi:hypothetical protein
MKNEILVGLAWAGGILLLTFGATLAAHRGYIEDDTMLRVTAMNGLVIAYYGNRAPKVIAPTAHARQVTRVAGWAFVLGGLLYAALWAFAPLPVATTVGTGAVAAGVIVTLGYCSWLRAQSRPQVG